MTEVVILDIDGTLVDSNYHHALAWDRAFTAAGVAVPLWRIHRHIGMGGDQLVEALAGSDVERELGDRIRAAEGERYAELIGEVRPVPGARELIEALKRAGRLVILASSAKEDEVDHYLDLLGARELTDGWTTSADVEATKPEPDLVRAALKLAERQGWIPTERADLIGDSVWDVEAAARAGVSPTGVLTGGFGEEELRAAGAIAVYQSVAELAEGSRLASGSR
ncbi:MAG TPA: HAD family hydrolase [Solirubrobacterales bacterium]|jgi:phosphoglycolate phosphatase-like HAD superfamily hydrolase